MWFFYAVALPLLLLAIVFALRVMPAKGTSWLVYIDVGLAWFSALSAMVLVPTDVSTTLEGRHPELLRSWWKLSYWYGFVVMFTLLPFHQEYADSGHFYIADRCVQSLRNNLIFYAVLTVLGAAGLVLLLVTGELIPSNVIGFCIAASNAFGLIAGIFVMGYGLVAIPRQLWRTASIRGQERLLQHRAGVQAEKAFAARSELNKARMEVHKVAELFSRRDPMRKYMNQILEMASQYEAEAGPVQAEEDSAPDADYFDRQDLGKLRRRLRKGIEGFQRERELFIELVQEYVQVEDVLSNMKHGAPYRSSVHGETSQLVAYLEWYWKCALRGWSFRLLAILAALLSLAILVAESTISPQLPNLSVFSLLLHKLGGSQFTRSLLTFASLAYPCMAAYYALFKMGRFGFYLLVPGHTNAYSLLTNALLMCRFAPPLAFNFMAALAMPASKHDERHDVTETVFYQEFGSLMMRQPLIGFEFTTYAPIVLVPYIILLVFNVFNRMAAFCLRSPTFLFEDDWELHSPYATTGTRLLQLELENFATGKPMGLTISPQGDDPELGKKKRWWSFGFGRRPTLLQNDHLASPAGPPLSPQVVEARTRLSRALGKDAPPTSRQVQQPGPGPTLPNVRSFLRMGDSESETARLMTGQADSSDGDLDSIFAKMDGSQQQATRGPRPSAALSVESDSEEQSGGLSKWFRRNR